MYADVTTESDLINKTGNKVLAQQINLYGLSSLWAITGIGCLCIGGCWCCFFLIKSQEDLNPFDKQDEHEHVIRVSDPQLLHSHCIPATILISIFEDCTFLL